MSSFHITPNGPAPCSTTVGTCPYAADNPHFETTDAAQEHFASLHGGTVPPVKRNSKSRTYAPAKPVLELPTKEEVTEALSRNTSESYPVTRGNLIGYTLTGSAMYGLDHPESDRDILAITDEERGGDFHHVYPDGTDIRATSLSRIANRAMDGKTGEVDLLRSPILTIENENYAPYFSNLRIDTLKYCDNMESHLRADVNNFLRDGIDLKRGAKSLKTALRNAFVSARVQAHGLDYRIHFDSDAREFFYAQLHHLTRNRLLKQMEETPKEGREQMMDQFIADLYALGFDDRNLNSR